VGALFAMHFLVMPSAETLEEEGERSAAACPDRAAGAAASCSAAAREAPADPRALIGATVARCVAAGGGVEQEGVVLSYDAPAAGADNASAGAWRVLYADRSTPSVRWEQLAAQLRPDLQNKEYLGVTYRCTSSSAPPPGCAQQARAGRCWMASVSLRLEGEAGRTYFSFFKHAHKLQAAHAHDDGVRELRKEHPEHERLLKVNFPQQQLGERQGVAGPRRARAPSAPADPAAASLREAAAALATAMSDDDDDHDDAPPVRLTPAMKRLRRTQLGHIVQSDGDVGDEAADGAAQASSAAAEEEEDGYEDAVAAAATPMITQPRDAGAAGASASAPPAASAAPHLASGSSGVTAAALIASRAATAAERCRAARESAAVAAAELRAAEEEEAVLRAHTDAAAAAAAARAAADKCQADAKAIADDAARLEAEIADNRSRAALARAAADAAQEQVHATARALEAAEAAATRLLATRNNAAATTMMLTQ
jgi:hypothetical protein